MKSHSEANNMSLKKTFLCKKITLVLIFLLSSTIFIGQELPDVPKKLVSDNANLLSNQELNYLERKLVDYNDSTSTQIAILIVSDLQGYDIVDFAQRVGHKWGIGQKGKDNGAIIVLVPKSSSVKGEINLDVGYGLEPYIPDITAKRIIENEMIPRFANNDYFGGIDAGTNVIMSLASGHFTADDYGKNAGKGGGMGWIVPIIIMIIVISMINRKRQGQYTAGGSSSSFWTALMLGSMLGGSNSGSWGNFNSGSGGFGGGGGGGFGGFGGGGFGGGGASGSW